MENIIWKDIKGYEGEYQVSNTGLVRSLDRYVRCHTDSKRLVKGVIMKPQTDKDGYKYVGISAGKRIHRLVAQAFIPNPNNLPLVLHRDDNPANNHMDNLDWGTTQDNVDDRNKKGRQVKGNKVHTNILTQEQVKEILASYTGKRGQQVELGRQYGVCISTINKIIKGKNWKHI